MENQNSQEKNTHTHTSSFLRWTLTFAIAIVLNLIFNYGLYSFYKPVEYEAFCPLTLTNQNYTEENLCTQNGGQWNSYTQNKDARQSVVATEPSGFCNVTYTCQKSYEVNQALYNRNVFIVLVVFGIASLVAAFFYFQYATVAYGLALGGLLSLVIGSVRYWSNMQDTIRLIVLVVCLIVLIWVGVKKLKE